LRQSDFAKIGMPVKISFEPAGEEIFLPKFRPAQAGVNKRKSFFPD
jgi:hypothetical protein